MKEVYRFLKEANTYYLATMDGEKPRVRPFGTIDLFEDKLYIQTGKVKAVSMQMHDNPWVEICAFKGGEWLRVSAKAIADDRVEARAHMLNEYPALRKMYDENDGNTEVFYLENATATFSSFGGVPKTIFF